MIYSGYKNILRILLLLAAAHNLMAQSADQIKQAYVCNGHKVVPARYVSCTQLLNDWYQLPQVNFWQQIVSNHPDSSVVNIANTRTPLFTVNTAQWKLQTEPRKLEVKDSIRKFYNLDSTVALNVTAGKGDFYDFANAIDEIDKAIPIFKKYDTDPWYAQAILLIESPGKLGARSTAGAVGAFQLMPDVARAMGLRVNRKVDERKNFERSAVASARFIRAYCIPLAKKVCQQNGIVYNREDLWFKLLTMHIYNAGYGNVNAAVEKMCPQSGGKEFIKQLWLTEAGQFKNQSQNYSQIVLACMANFTKMMNATDTVYEHQGDRFLYAYNQASSKNMLMLEQGLKVYQQDLLSGKVNFEKFKEVFLFINGELASTNRSPQEIDGLTASELNTAALELMNNLKLTSAISLLHLNEKLNPQNASVYDTLSVAYARQGNKALARKYELLAQKTKQSKP